MKRIALMAVLALMVGCSDADPDAPYCAIYEMWDCAPTQDGATRYPLCDGDFSRPMLSCTADDDPSDVCAPGEIPLCCELLPSDGGWICD